MRRIIEFCNDNLDELRGEQKRIEDESGVRYPLMKLADMHFWQIGFDLAPPKVRKAILDGK